MIPSLRLETLPIVRAGRASRATEPAVLGMAAGTRLETADGRIAVEDIVPGQMLDTTLGLQEVVAVLRLRPCPLASCAQVDLPAGLMGLTRSMIVAGEQEIVVSGWLAELHFGTDAVSMTAANLVEAGLAKRLARTAEVDLYLPVLAQPCAVYAGHFALAVSGPDHGAASVAQPFDAGLLALTAPEVGVVARLMSEVVYH